MNNFELHELAQELSDTYSPYKLAKALLRATESEIAWRDNGCGNCLDFTKALKEFLND